MVRKSTQFSIGLVLLAIFTVSCVASPSRRMGGDPPTASPSSTPSVAISGSQDPRREPTTRAAESSSNPTGTSPEGTARPTRRTQEQPTDPTQSASPEGRPNPTDSPSGNDPTKKIEGDCNAHGSGNSVNCVRELPDRIGNVELYRNPAVTYIFDGPVTRLPRPPAYSKDEAYFHCGKWSNLLTRHPDFYTSEPAGGISAVSGQADQVAIVGYEVLIYSRKEIKGRKLTQIRCGYGGGTNNLWEIEYDTRSRKAVLKKFSSGASRGQPVPPASINVTGANYTGVILSIKSSSKYLYSGRVVVTAVINGKRKELAIGSRKYPHKWVGGAFGNPIFESTPYWDWDPSKRRWVKNFEPQGDEPQGE